MKFSAKDRMRGIAEVRTLCSDIIVAKISGQFDWALSIFAYHHVPDDKKIQYLQKAFKEAQIKEVGFRVIEERKIWPLDDSFSVDVGTFVTILQKTH